MNMVTSDALPEQSAISFKTGVSESQSTTQVGISDGNEPLAAAGVELTEPSNIDKREDTLNNPMKSDSREENSQPELLESASLKTNDIEDVAPTQITEKSGIVSNKPSALEQSTSQTENIVEVHHSKESSDKEKIDAFSDDEILFNSDVASSSEADSDGKGSSSSDSSSESSDSSDSDSEENDIDLESGTKSSGPMDELEEEDDAISGPIMSKNEVADEKANSLPADYSVPENSPLEYIGTLTGLVEKSAIIKANVSGEFRILKDDSVLCFEDRQLLGPLFETFGRLQAPNYRVKFNTQEEFEKFKDKKGSKVFYVVPSSQFVYTDALKKIKGTDASNCHDEELPEDEQEYSDDEQELAAKQEKNRKRKQKKQDTGDIPQKKKTAVSKSENTFVSYGFAQRQPEAPSASNQQNLQHHHHNPVLHGPPFTQPMQHSPSNYGVPILQVQTDMYDRSNTTEGYPAQYQVQQPYVQQPYVQQLYVQQPYVQQPYVQQSYAQQPLYQSQNGYGQHTQSYPSPYGQPYNYTPTAQPQLYYGQPASGLLGTQNAGNLQQYGQPYHLQMPSQEHSGQPYAQNVQQGNSSYKGPYNDSPNEALQQLQQMVSQNLAKGKQN